MPDLEKIIFRQNPYANDVKLRESAEGKFKEWYANRPGAMQFVPDELANMYGSILIHTLSHVFAAGFMKRRREEGNAGSLRGIWQSYEIAMQGFPDYFRGYAYASHADMLSSLAIVYMLGYFTE